MRQGDKEKGRHRERKQSERRQEETLEGGTATNIKSDMPSKLISDKRHNATNITSDKDHNVTNVISDTS